jgi:4-hydroxythreonine-4-phosphate dehydrogenase
MTGWIGISLGDITGIGSEVTLKALDREWQKDGTRYLLFGDTADLRESNEQLRLNLPLEPWSARRGSGQIFLADPTVEPLQRGLAHGAPEAANASIAWLEQGARRCLARELDALVTAPVNKEAIVRAGHSFVGQTEFLSEMAGSPRSAMMLLGEDDRGRWLRVALATTHVPLKDVASRLTREKIELAVELAVEACQRLVLPRQRIAVCGLNPHAGEGGKMGDEEQVVIGPAVQAMRGRGYDVTGPVSADALFYSAYNGGYDAVVAMYHDQGLVPLKMVCFENGVNWTLGLPFIRTSPDHGTAYDIAGQNKANPSSMVAAIRLAKQLVKAKSFDPRTPGTPG